MDFHPQHGDGSMPLRNVNIAVFHLAAINNRDGAGTDHFAGPIWPDNKGCIFVNAHAKFGGIEGDGSHQPPDSISLAKVLVDYDVSCQAESRCELHHAL